MCDGADDDVGIPRLLFGEVGGMSCFVCRGGGRWIDWILGQRHGRQKMNAAPLR